MMNYKAYYEDQPDQYEMSSPYIDDDQPNKIRQPLLVITEKSDKSNSNQSNDYLSTPGFKGALNSGILEFSYQLESLFDEAEMISGNRNESSKEQQQYTNPLLNFYLQLPVFLPNSVLMLIWKGIILGITLLYFFIIPITVCYGYNVWIFSPPNIGKIDLTCFILWTLDLQLEFLTAFYEHGNLITDKKRIAFQYLMRNFVFDFIALSTFGIMSIIKPVDFREFLLLFYFKYPSMVKIDYFFEEATLLHRTLRTIYNIGRIIVTLQFCFLIFSCVFYVIGHASIKAGYNSWLLNDGNFGVIYDMDEGFQFFFSYYFGLGTMTTTMGYGDITPLNVFECLWCLGGIFFAVFIFQVNVNSLFKIMEEYNVHPIKIFKKRIAINKFMKSKNVSISVQERVRRYLNEHWYEEGTRDMIQEQEVFMELAPEVKEELFFNSYGKMFNYISFMQGIFSVDFQRQLSIKIEEISYAQNEIIFLDRVDQQVDDFSIYFIDYGEILIFANTDSNRPFWIKQLQSGSYFGEWSFLTGRPRLASASALIYSRVYKLKREVFLEIISQFPDDYENYWMMRDKLIYSKGFSSINSSCYICNSQRHYASQCPTTHYVPKNIQFIFKRTEVEQPRKIYYRQRVLKWRTLRQVQNISNQTQLEQILNQQTEPSNQIKVESTQKQKIIFDKPYQFKLYFPQHNLQKMQVFTNTNQTEMSKIINVRKSMLFIPNQQKSQTKQSAIFVWPKQN